MTRVVREQVSIRWKELHRPRGFLASVAVWFLTALILFLGLGLLLVAIVVAIPVGLVVGGWWWVRSKFRALRGVNPGGDDGRRNVRVRGIQSSP